MDLAQLRAFIAIVNADGLSRAAERLHVSQSALSRQLQGLELKLGLPLFTREHRRLILTPAGEELIGHAHALLADAEAVRERLRAFERGEKGIIRLGATPPMIEAPLAQFLGEWRQKHPEIAVHLVEDGGSALAERLDQGEVHLAYVPAGDDRFDYRLLYPIHVVAAISASHPLSRSRTVELVEVAKHPLVALKKGFGSRDWFDDACRDANVRPSIVLESASQNAVLALATAQYGIGILPSAVLPPSGVALLPLVQSATPIGRWTMLAWSKRRYRPLYIKKFVDALEAFALKHHPGRQFMKRAPPIALPTSGTSPAERSAIPGKTRRGKLRP